LVSKVWKEVGLKQHLTKSFKVSYDPNFEEKPDDIVVLYMSLPEHAVVFAWMSKASFKY